MSDIGLRTDGVPLFALVALGTLVYAVVALISGGITFLGRRRNGRAERIARAAGAMGLGSGLCLFAVAVYFMNRLPPEGTDWIDWLSVPYAVAFIAGCIFLFRRSP
jgi:hypothetical protein